MPTVRATDKKGSTYKIQYVFICNTIQVSNLKTRRLTHLSWQSTYCIDVTVRSRQTSRQTSKLSVDRPLIDGRGGSVSVKSLGEEQGVGGTISVSKPITQRRRHQRSS